MHDGAGPEMTALVLQQPLKMQKVGRTSGLARTTGLLLSLEDVQRGPEVTFAWVVAAEKVPSRDWKSIVQSVQYLGFACWGEGDGPGKKGR